MPALVCGPRANFDSGNGKWGALQVVARYHELNVDDDIFALGLAAPGSAAKAEACTRRRELVPAPHLPVHLNYEHTEFEGAPTAPPRAENVILFRVQTRISERRIDDVMAIIMTII